MVTSIEPNTPEPYELPSLLDVQHISFGYHKKALLYDISVQFQPGEMVGLLGPNGSGKTTLLRLLSGVFQPQQGEILLQGKNLRQWRRREIARRIAVVPQELHIPFAFTVEHMVSLGRTPFVSPLWGSRTQHDHDIMHEAMLAAGVEAFSDRVFNELSGGERQRVLIAMALAQQPAALLLDEPTSHLDIKYQVETLELVQRLNRERGMTIIAALHDLNLASRYFPRLILFQRGIVADASPAEVLEPALLSRVYGIHVQVGILRGAEHLSVLPPVLTPDTIHPSHSHIHPYIHVIAGGGSGALMMRALADAHIPFIAGSLNIGDSDHALALRLADHVITEQPYSPISDPVLAQVRASLASVSVLIICPTAIGSGNLVLLQEAVAAAQRGLPIILLSSPSSSSPTTCLNPSEDDIQVTDLSSPSPPITIVPSNDLLADLSARDYTGGAGLQALRDLLHLNALVAPSVSDALEMVRQRTHSQSTASD